eukprot:3275374-Rhodomonas_salina.2
MPVPDIEQQRRRIPGQRLPYRISDGVPPSIGQYQASPSKLIGHSGHRGGLYPIWREGKWKEVTGARERPCTSRTSLSLAQIQPNQPWFSLTSSKAALA